jgi:hypothetical protein
VRELTNVYAPIQDWQLNWSNDGEWLYVLKDVNGERIWHRIQVDGENLRAVPNYEGFHSAAWSPAKEQNRMRLLISLVVGLAACSSILLVNFLPLFRRRSQKEKGIKVADPALTTSV